jgi:hypothetical protein
MTYTQKPSGVANVDSLYTHRRTSRRAHLCPSVVHDSPELTELRGPPPASQSRRTPNERLASGGSDRPKLRRHPHNHAMQAPDSEPAGIFARPGSRRTRRPGYAAPDPRLRIQPTFPGEIGGGCRQRLPGQRHAPRRRSLTTGS